MQGRSFKTNEVRLILCVFVCAFMPVEEENAEACGVCNEIHLQSSCYLTSDYYRILTTVIVSYEFL